tara:strand:+ start:8358 stop:9764 length:1407 start_codon:yes stop_codon:yes gene_type:complete
MGKQKLKGKTLKKIGYQSNTARSLAINIMAKHYKHITANEQLELLQAIQATPEKYTDNETLKPIAAQFMEVVEEEHFTAYQLKEESKPYSVFGKPFIDPMAIRQMDQVMRLPIAKNGALMPDAHVGYGLPIGGVLATENEIIPYGVGLDIGCRMSLSIVDIPLAQGLRKKHQLKTALKEKTFFGIGTLKDHFEEHEVLENEAFQQTELLRQLHGKAAKQIGTSGSGNHFVEFGKVTLAENNQLNLPVGDYLGILSHSGSRGLGATVANYYTQVAMDVCRLPKGSQHLAWLDLNSEAGMEYWIAMNLAGEYAKACHDVIHRNLMKAIGARLVKRVENHHNFAWKEMQDDGCELLVHRKGATPAKANELGIIPATMSEPGYIVSGKGNPEALHSASHGAGRKFSRKKARESFTQSAIKKHLKGKGITLIGGGTDEAPMAYKNIEEVMKSQEENVKVEGTFQPFIVRMNKD